MSDDKSDEKNCIDVGLEHFDLFIDYALSVPQTSTLGSIRDQPGGLETILSLASNLAQTMAANCTLEEVRNSLGQLHNPDRPAQGR
jgi:hypothetical protein